jgi:hypothetical protein
MSALTTSRIARSAAVVAMAGGAVAGAVSLSAAAPAVAAHTLKFTTVQIADQQLGYYDVAANKEISGGKTVGYDTTDCKINIDTHLAKCVIAASRAEGTFRGKVTLNLDSGAGSGTITGGTRAFKGATGTVTAKAVSNTKTLVTITYHS